MSERSELRQNNYEAKCRSPMVISRLEVDTAAFDDNQKRPDFLTCMESSSRTLDLKQAATDYAFKRLTMSKLESTSSARLLHTPC